MKLQIDRSVLMQLRMNAENTIKTIDEIMGDAMDGTSFTRMTKAEKGEYILDGVCAFYDIDRASLLKKTNATTIVTRRKYVMQALTDYAHFTEHEIAKLIGYNPQSIYYHLKDLRDKFSDSAFGDGKMQAVYHSILQYIKLEKGEAA